MINLHHCVLHLSPRIVMGNIWPDLSRYRNNGRIRGAHLRDGGLKVNRLDDFVNLGNHNSLNITDAITIEAVVRPMDNKWRYMRPITLNPAPPLPNYQVKIELTTANFDYSKTKSDGSDLRFYQPDGQKLSYWIEEWNPSGISIIWVKVANAGTDTIYMYYGNPDAEPVSDGDATFDFFDDFNSDTIADTEPDVVISAISGRYEAWPGVAKSKDGTLYVVYRTSDSETHMFDETGRIVMRKSTDGGQTWSDEIVVADDEGLDDRGPNIIIFDDKGVETILVVYRTWDGGDNHYAYCRKSTDGGQTWSDKIPLSNNSPRITKGRPILLSNGKLLVPLYDKADSGHTYVAESSDGGDTWTEYVVCDTYGGEFSIVEVKTNGEYSGKVYGILRNDASPYTFKKTISEDYGHTWSPLADIEDFKNPCATFLDLFRAAENEILAAYTTSGGELVIYKSTDEGNSWQYAKTVVSTQSQSYYPSLALVNSNKLIIVWCTNKRSPDSSDVYANFADYPLVADKWIIYQGSKPSISDSILVLNSPTQKMHSVYYRNGYTNPMVLEMQVRHNNIRIAGLSKIDDGNVDSANYIVINGFYSHFRAEYEDDGWHGDVGLTENTWRKYKIIWSNEDIYGHEDSTLLGHKTPSDGNGIPDYDAWVYFYIYSGDENPLIEVDWVRIRKYSDSEPVATLGNETAVGVTKPGSYGLGVDGSTVIASINDQILTAPISPNESFVALTYDKNEGKIKLFVDGVKKATTDYSDSIVSSSNNLRITNFFIVELFIYNKAKTEEQIRIDAELISRYGTR